MLLRLDEDAQRLVEMREAQQRNDQNRSQLQGEEDPRDEPILLDRHHRKN